MELKTVFLHLCLTMLQTMILWSKELSPEQPKRVSISTRLGPVFIACHTLSILPPSSYLRQSGPSPRRKPKRPCPEVAIIKIPHQHLLVVLMMTTLLRKLTETKRRRLVYPLMHRAIYCLPLKSFVKSSAQFVPALSGSRHGSSNLKTHFGARTVLSDNVH
ncbi:uncharacterized protein LACBIDRAFT_306678 [Laccaria bicolor S238N-H82]|uniref:Predicted protein n=1 Tax=Laccaria bicolor (strain S238N-H82 / ATCC MYA-4686) TaxID=486041 RepID=B0DNJ1_LACBS|nr:uncharacterized protein LACBIDRAFT_306678 [Laccaria bicolor S238N-H82]EDR03950.1 predicted protein [Laccaria bicolor S238N-H82]|eukprot:XP_001885518.1 predicted protein [Laccaria bicolor S238N-H82]